MIAETLVRAGPRIDTASSAVGHLHVTPRQAAIWLLQSVITQLRMLPLVRQLVKAQSTT
jgi:hypothetical protein